MAYWLAVACNYHDVGKMKNAAYFAENFRGGDNPHNRLKPSMSALIIRSHVKDTIEMMREHGIPEAVIDTASQHHGTSLIAFFYHKALEARTDEDDVVREQDYRYPGPKPQTREAGIIMLADGVEAAARSLSEPTPDRLRALVQRIINARFTDGQLDQCDLTLRDLHSIAKQFLQVLSGIYHQRPTYPGQKEDEQRRATESMGRKRRVESHEQLLPTPSAKDGGSSQHQAAPSDAKQKTKTKSKPKDQAPTEPEKQETSADEIDIGGGSEVAPESSQDIKRLGMN